MIHFLRDISTKDEIIAINEIVDLIRDYKTKKVYVDMPVDIVERIIQIKNENKKIGVQKIANEAGVQPDKVREILMANNMWDFKVEASSKLKLLQKFARNPEKLAMIENKGIIDDSYIFDAVVEKAIEESSINLGSAHTDEPVTADIRRLIRMASSLHGGSGMRVVPLKLAGLGKFEPLNDAVVFGEKEIKIEVISPLKPQNAMVEMKGKSFTIKEGINTLPEYAAMYLMCRGAAEYA